MKSTKQKWMFVIVICLIGILIGVGVTFFITTSVSEKAFRIYLDNTLSWEENEAVAKFKDDAPLVAIYAQERLIICANRLKEMNALDENNYYGIVGFAEARKGFLYESIGETNKSTECFQNAIVTLKKGNIITNIKELKSSLISSKGLKNKEDDKKIEK